MPATESSKPRRHRRFRRRLRTRIILSFVLLGFGLTTLFAYLTEVTRRRVENQLVEDVLNRNIDEYGRRFQLNPRQVDVPVQQMHARIVRPDSFERLRVEEPDWYEFKDGIHNLGGIDENGQSFSFLSSSSRCFPSLSAGGPRPA